ncbi:MAG TPA: cyclopropane-fatty-acyl-phospholipid synthase family protein [Terriglobales bacterium]|jgi:cyclopropane-fatty-acyl-phospholipid synthase|nr:cyclopropane-fatty-acyl-phospholipid synthase family protein [Terriglobales bacterium]
MANRAASLAKKLFLKSLTSLDIGFLEIVCPEDTYRFGHADDPLRATIAVHDERFFRRAVLGGDVGIGESYMQGEWSTPDLIAVVQLGVRNLDRLEQGSRLLGIVSRAVDFFSHRRNANTLDGSRRNISYHYDLGNDFYRLFLDRNLMYSCAYYEDEQDSLESAQIQKLDLICQKLKLSSADHVLEIGTGWGGFAVHAAKNYGCKITTTTISRQQHDYAQQVFSAADTDRGEITLLFEDYRKLRGQFDKIVSIEMFEAVGLDHYDDFFGKCNELLKPDGSMLLQTITIQESKFAQYKRRSDWIKKYIFPGAELASVVEIQQSLKRSTKMQLFHMEDIGMHYALTLHEWRRRFLERVGEVTQMGFDSIFCRMWDYYLGYCEGAFKERYISDVQLVLSKTATGRRLLNEPEQTADFATTRPLSAPQDAL